MMNCGEFKEWLGNRDPREEKMDGRAAAHIRACERCGALLEMDGRLETALNRGLKKSPTPDSLLSRLEVDFGASGNSGPANLFAPLKRLGPTARISAPLAAAAVLVLLFLGPLKTGVNTLDEIGKHAVKSHMNNLAMTFTVSEVSDISGWFEKRLGYTVTPPDLSGDGYRLSGGRQCHLGPCDAAYLFYEKDEKRASLFVIRADDVDLKMKEGETYRCSVGECEVKFWRESQNLYALVI